MSANRFFGLNIAVNNLEDAKKNFESLFKVEPRYVAEKEFAFPNLEGYQFDLNGIKIHIVASKTEDTSIANFVKKKGEGVFLVSIQTDDIDKEVERIKGETTGQFVTETTDVGWCKVNFIHPKTMHGVQVEMIQTK